MSAFAVIISVHWLSEDQPSERRPLRRLDPRGPNVIQVFLHQHVVACFQLGERSWHDVCRQIRQTHSLPAEAVHGVVLRVCRLQTDALLPHGLREVERATTMLHAREHLTDILPEMSILIATLFLG